MDDDSILDAIGPRLRGLRRTRGATLASLSTDTGISVSTLSRLESGARRPTLELLLPLARVHGIALDELVQATSTIDPRVRSRAVRHHGRTLIPLSRRPGGLQAYKMIIPPGLADAEQQSHEGYEWLYVLDGRVRLRLAELDLVLDAGEAAEFDTHTPHWFGAEGPRAAELLVLFGPQGERVHVRARTRRRAAAAARRVPGAAEASLDRRP